MKVILSREAVKQYKKLPKPGRKKINKALSHLQIEPQAGKKLKGELGGKWSYKVYPYRIIYKISNKVFQVVTLRHRQGAYK